MCINTFQNYTWMLYLMQKLLNKDQNGYGLHLLYVALMGMFNNRWKLWVFSFFYNVFFFDNIGGADAFLSFFLTVAAWCMLCFFYGNSLSTWLWLFGCDFCFIIEAACASGMPIYRIHCFVWCIVLSIVVIVVIVIIGVFGLVCF